MGSTTIKVVKGREYLYYVYYENRQKKNIYCGLASKSESKKKAMQLEIKSLKEQKKGMTARVVELESEINSL